MAENVAVEYAKRFRPPLSIIEKYISSGSFSRISEIISSPAVPDDIKSILRAGSLRSEGREEEAISILLRANSKYFAVRRRIALNLRAIYNENREHEKVASVLVGFLSAEQTKILISMGISAAASAEAADNGELFTAAISRVMSDIERIREKPRLFKRHWKEAVSGLLAIFDIEGAINIAQRAKESGLNVKGILDDTLRLKEELVPIAHVVKEAHRDVLGRAGNTLQSPAAKQVVVIMPGAAVRTNKRDYPGFRSDIRKCLTGVVRTLDADGVSYSVKSRIWNHGCIKLEVPFFSYHTVSAGQLGLHYKETDRPSLFSFDEKGYAGWSAFSEVTLENMKSYALDPDSIDSFFERDRYAIVMSRLSKYRQQELREVLPGRFIFVALQVMGDAVQHLSYTTPFSMVDEVIKVARDHDLSVVVKRHPACNSVEIARFLEEMVKDGRLIVAGGNIHDIIPRAMAVCVVNSGVGAEALIYEKPVFVFGRSDYMGACFVCQKPGDFGRLFVEGKTRLSAADLRKYWYLYRNVYACDLRDEERASKWIAERVRAHLRLFAGQEHAV